MHPFVEKLLEGEKVEWKTLGEVCDYEQPSKYLVTSKEYKDEYLTPVLTAGKTFILGYTDETNGIYKASKNPCIIFDDFTTANKWIDFDFKIKSSAIKILTSKDENKVLLKFIFYWINTIYNIGEFSDHKRQWISHFSLLSFPIPPLKTQQKIVDILDKLCELKNALKNALKNERVLRLKQYAYYRDKLLSFDEGVERKPLGEVAPYSQTRISAEELNKNNYVGVDNLLQNRLGKTISTHIPKEGKYTEYKKEDILIGNIRPYLKKIYFAKENGGASGDVLVIHPTNKNIYPRFLFHVLANDDFFIFNMKYAKGGKMPRGNKKEILNYPIPLPSLEKQKEIVEILDKFDKLTNDIAEGLPREIELREKQYCYYRDLLLTFD